MKEGVAAASEREARRDLVAALRSAERLETDQALGCCGMVECLVERRKGERLFVYSFQA